MTKSMSPLDEVEGSKKGVEEPVQTRGLQVPVDRQDPLAVGGENPGGVGQGHGAARTSLVRVEGDDPACRRAGKCRVHHNAVSSFVGWLLTTGLAMLFGNDLLWSTRLCISDLI